MVVPSLNAAGRVLDATQLVTVLATRTAHLNAIIDHVPVILAEVDGDGVFTLCEGDGLRLLAKRPVDFVGLTIAELYPERPELGDDHRRALAGAAFSRILELGGRTWQATYEPMLGPGNHPVGFICVLLDVTDATRADAQRRTSDRRLNLLTRSMPIVLFAVNRDGIFTLAEGKGLALSGLDPSALIGHSLDEVLPNVAPTLRLLHQRALAGEEFAATLQLGTRTWDMRFLPTRDADGEVDGVCAVALDVTERVRSERDLESTRRREAGIAELSRAVLAGTALSEVLQAAVNLVARELQGIDYAAVGEMTPAGMQRIAAVGVPEDEIPAMLTPEPTTYAAMRSVRAGQSVIVTDWDDESRFPQPTWLQLERVKSSAFLPIVTQADHRVFGFIGAHSKRRREFPEHDIAFLETVANLLGDVIARQHAQDAAAQQAEQFRALAENSPNIITRFGRDLRMLYINGTVERLTGTPANTLIGHTPRESGVPDPQASALELALHQVLNTGERRTIDLHLQTVLGPRTFQGRMAPEFAPDGGVESVVVDTHDITERQLADEERLSVYRQLLAQQAQLQELLARLTTTHEQELERATTDQRLTDRQREILNLVVRGWTNAEIAAELRLSRGNVKNQVSRLLRTLDVSDRIEAATLAVRLGLVEVSLGSRSVPIGTRSGSLGSRSVPLAAN